jgi:hypothetical protein
MDTANGRGDKRQEDPGQSSSRTADETRDRRFVLYRLKTASIFLLRRIKRDSCPEIPVRFPGKTDDFRYTLLLAGERSANRMQRRIQQG